MTHVSPYPLGIKPKHNFSDYKTDRFEGKTQWKVLTGDLTHQQKLLLRNFISWDASSHNPLTLSRTYLHALVPAGG